jgi:hypothetical protein
VYRFFSEFGLGYLAGVETAVIAGRQHVKILALYFSAEGFLQGIHVKNNSVFMPR